MHIGLQTAGIGFGYLQGFGRNIPRIDPTIGELQFQADCYAARTRTCVEHFKARRGASCNGFGSPSHQFLRFGAWNEHTRRHAEAVAAKFGMPQNILHRLTCRKALAYIHKP